jgi:hypothetical protein
MTVIVTPLTVAEVATVINAFITFVSFTIALSLVVLLVKFLPTTTTAIAWSSISRTLHSSVWPTILGTDSKSGQTEGAVVSTLTRLGTVTTILVAAAGVILPLGLSEGPIVHGNFRLLKGVYIHDTSPLALSTTPNQGSFVYGRQCGSIGPTICPGNDNPNTTTIVPSIVDIFNSTPHGPFTMQFRRFFQGDQTLNCSVGFEASAEMFVLRNNTFFAEGLIIDMTNEHPGIGLWNQTVPTEVRTGGTWTQDILWIEPETQCVDTNLTVDYFRPQRPSAEIEQFNITDHGGFYKLTHDPPPPLNRNGQDIDLREHAYKGAAYSNLFAMLFLNTTRETSFEGASYPLTPGHNFNGSGITTFDLQKISHIPLSYLNSSETSSTSIVCRGFGGGDTANITNVHVDCGIFLGPPLRTDGGDPRIFDRGSRWAQGIHACASATRVSVQTVTFASNSSSDIQGLQISRDSNSLSVLWGTEKTNLNISDIDLFWGRVSDRYENDPSLWTTRSNRFYLPAGSASIFPAFSPGNAGPAHAEAWGVAYETGFGKDASQDYSGERNYALKAKLQSLVEADPIRGNAQIRNLVFTDVMANNIIGKQFNDALLVADHLKSLSYDFRYAIPGFILLALWAPSFFLAAFFFLTRIVSFGHMKDVFNHTSVGRVVVGTSALRVQSQSGSPPFMPVPQHYTDVNVGNASRGGGGLFGHRRNKSDWANSGGKTRVTLNLNNAPPSTLEWNEEDAKLIGSHSNRA